MNEPLQYPEPLPIEFWVKALNQTGKFLDVSTVPIKLGTTAFITASTGPAIPAKVVRQVPRSEFDAWCRELGLELPPAAFQYAFELQPD